MKRTDPIEPVTHYLKTNEPDVIKRPAHYIDHPSGIEPIQITKFESFLRGNIIKYVMRAPYKGTELQDLRKAKQYLEWEIERVQALQEDQTA